MRLHIWANKTNYKEYTVRLLQLVLAPWLVGSPEDADVVLVSICDISEVGDILKARKATGKPIMAGGMVSEYPVVNELADYVWHGEVYALGDLLKQGMALEEMPYVTTKAKRLLAINQVIDWRRNPIVKVGRRAMYYYVSKGCPVRCKYCLIGNARQYQQVPERLYRKALGVCGKGLMPIAAYNPYGVPAAANIGETLMRKYNAGKTGDGAKMIRTGCEFVGKSLSVGLAKGVGIDHLNECIARAGRERTKLIIYYIAGLESQDDLDNYFSQIVIDYNSTPAVNLVFTYIDPQPCTPMHDYDLRRKITGIDTKRLYRIASERNKRVRVLPLAGPERSTVRTLLGRATSVAEYDLIMAIKRLPHAEMLGRLGDEAPHLLGESNLDLVLARPRRGTIQEYWDRGGEEC